MGFITCRNNVDDSVEGGKKTAGTRDKVLRESKQKILTNQIQENIKWVQSKVRATNFEMLRSSK